ncbi:hypothetical protein PAHAL_1G005200 [Panicum hallii]|uniref:Uncharacterized protein n=1 Tax=Panicum hallii TaxID=206008 RepID=A0A2S3GKC6_9POAL|nr:uncharacterized protein LOC112890124 [Panicum hallii]XP_025812915.1 uncharacterized protein LOC112890124 [Panicum hallii]XP_025812983.1 uncharacterized protein LOC112890124 [Panicum hallii]PAN03520.1 hypothetical protein PAHAL_1G005200 [Panicum hallii]PAN03521.1 hypothetical protein PAHAL_1G005200 [Panicum hallii]PAN03522.1 hypothetical protein PAHAL_1G005200 [Panicum hallii]PVH65481.1 hypothetical protein PAHAL_1G005200 [Panicum hallii]
MAQPAAAAAAAIALRRPLLLSLKPARLLTSLAAPSPGIRHPRALRPTGPLPADTAEDTDDPDAGDGSAEPFKKSRNALKREARRAVQWGMDLAKFPPPQIKRILRAASLETEVFDALMLVKRFGPDVREGKRRQFNYIGRLLRNAQPELMDTLIQASKDGDDSKLHALLSEEKLLVEDEEVEELPDEEEDDGEYMKIADRWFDGLLCKDISITNEVYAIHNVEFDRQELRQLVRRVQMVEESTSKDDEEGSNGKLSRAKKPLLRFLRSLAKEACAE